jgi:hypothetical protein
MANFKAMFDTFHANIEENDPVASILAHRSIITHVHISENNRGVPGRGHNNWTGIFKALRGTGYDNSCEVSRERPCGWHMIYERLKSLGRLDDMRRPQTPRDSRKRDISDANRRSIRWALELAKQDEAAAQPPAAKK